MVWIVVETSEGTSAGSGAIISPDGYILTAGHVVKGASKITVVVEESKQYGASIVSADYDIDVALLKIPAGSLTWLALGDSDEVRYDEEIQVLGYPLPQQGVGYIAVAGKVQGFRTYKDVTLIQHDAPTEGGHSGGPVINAQGEIIAVHTSWIGGEHSQYTIGVAINSAEQIIPYGVLPSSPSPVQPAATPTAHAGPIRVPEDYVTIQAAVQAAPEGGEIRVSSGTYKGDIAITKPISISSVTGSVIIEGTVRISGTKNVTLSHLQVTGCLEIHQVDSFSLDQVVVASSPADGIYIDASTGTISNCIVDEANNSGIVATFGAKITVAKTTVKRSGESGISLSLSSQARITECTIERNGGDGIYIVSSTAEIKGNKIQNNTGWGIASGGDATVMPTDLQTANTITDNSKGALFGIGPVFFLVTDVSVSPSSPFLFGTEATITATVTNTGGDEATRAVWLEVGEQKQEEISLTLKSKESKQVSFRYTFNSSADVTVCSSDTEGSIGSVSAKHSVFFSIGFIYVSPSLPLPGHAATISVAVINTGLHSGTRAVWCEVNGVRIGETSISLAAGETKTAVFRHGFPTDGTFSVTVGSGDNSRKSIVGVLSPECIRTLTGHTYYVNSVAFSPDAKALGRAQVQPLDRWFAEPK